LSDAAKAIGNLIANVRLEAGIDAGNSAFHRDPDHPFYPPLSRGLLRTGVNVSRRSRIILFGGSTIFGADFAKANFNAAIWGFELPSPPGEAAIPPDRCPAGPKLLVVFFPGGLADTGSKCRRRGPVV
jgi:hypothetical protein